MKTLQRIYEESPLFYFMAFFCFEFTMTTLLIKALKK